MLGAWCVWTVWAMDGWMARQDILYSKFLVGEDIDAATGAGEHRPGQRVFTDPDAYCWLRYARQLREAGGWRVRWSDIGNAPQGREMHWSQGPIWCLAGLARLGESMGMGRTDALEWAGRVFLPSFAAVFFFCFFLLLKGRLGAGAAAVMAVLYPIWRGGDYSALRPDHQAFQIGAALVFAVCLVLGDLGLGGEGRRERRLFALAGGAAAAGMWTGATVFFFVFGIAAVAVFAGILAAGRRRGGEAGRPGDAWRLMGVVGAVGGLGFYLLEYAPRFPGMRLEVNHPLYAAAFWGVCEVLGAWADWRSGARGLRELGRRERGTVLAGAGFALLLPVAILLGPVSWYWPRTGLMLTLHRHFITEFLSLTWLCAQNGAPVWQAVYATTGPIALCAAGCALFPRFMGADGRTARGRYVFTVLFGAGMLALLFWQVRWASYGLVGTMAVGVAAWLAGREKAGQAADAGPAADWRTRAFWRKNGLALGNMAVLALLCADVGCSVAPGMVALGRKKEDMAVAFLDDLLTRDLAKRLGEEAREEGRKAVVLGLATYAPAFRYFGDVGCLMGLYWENLPGMTDGAKILADRPPYAEARRLLADRGVTHIIVELGSDQAVMAAMLAGGSHNPRRAAGTLGDALIRDAGTGKALPAFCTYDAEENERLNPPLWVPPGKGKEPVDRRRKIAIYRVRDDVVGEGGRAGGGERGPAKGRTG